MEHLVAHRLEQRPHPREGRIEVPLQLREFASLAGVRERLDSHKLIEEFMVLANVAAAQALEHRQMPCMYRVHDRPTYEKLEGLRQFLDSIGLSLPKGQVLQPKSFTKLLERAENTAYKQMVNDLVLRSQAQAQYSPDNLGHFGLALRRYAHFTSPIRRYSDVLVHRGLIKALGGGWGDVPPEQAQPATVAQQ